MTAPLDLARCVRCSAASPLPLVELPLGGPWAIVYGPGVQSQTVAEDAEQHCQDHRVETRVRSIEDLGDDLQAWQYTSMIISLPDDLIGRNARDILRLVSNLVLVYRQDRPSGLSQIVAGQRKWWEVGGIQLIGPRALVHHPAMESARFEACAIHYLEAGSGSGCGSVNLMEPFFIPRGPAVRAVADSFTDDGLDRVWRHVRTWGIEGPRDVPRLLEAIGSCIADYEKMGDAFPALYRPDPDQPHLNRLQLILAGQDETVGKRKTWNENGARVWRKVQQDLSSVVPGFDRPIARRNTRGAQKDLFELYRNLQLIERARATRGWSPADHE